MVDANSAVENFRPGPSPKATEDNTPAPPAAGLTPEEELLLQQLQQTRFWAEKSRDSQANEVASDAPGQDGTDPIPESWTLTRGLVLHDWQESCVRAWLANGKRGVIKVVTGAGKT